jgi:hypothetical protein
VAVTHTPPSQPSRSQTSHVLSDAERRIINSEFQRLRDKMAETLGEAFPKQQARLRTLLGYGKEIGPAGQFYCMVIEDILKRADKAVMEQDLPAMISIYKEMQEVKE